MLSKRAQRATSQGSDGDPLSVQPPIGISRRAKLFIAIAALAYLIQIVATIPASVVVPQSSIIAATAGTLWNGRATLADGNMLEWRWAPLRSMISLGFAADWTINGVATNLVGRALLRRHSVLVDETSGSASESLLSLMTPGLPFVCATPLQIAIDRAEIGGSNQSLKGEIRADAGTCTSRSGGVATIIPPLNVHFGRLGDTSEIVIVPMSARRKTLVHGLLTRDGHLTVQVTPAGGHLFSFLSSPDGMKIDTVL